MEDMIDEQFMTAKQKATVLKQWTTFLKNGLRREDFTTGLYHHLTMHCSFIAHYGIDGFYSEYFKNGDDTKRFLAQFDSRGDQRGAELGATWWLTGPYSDLNRNMVIAGDPYIPNLIAKADSAQEDSDILRARVLLQKHGLTALPELPKTPGD